MPARTTPDVTRSDVRLVHVTECEAAHLDAVLDAWNQAPWPPGLLSRWCLLGEDGDSVLTYLQSADETATHPSRWDGTIEYQVYRGRCFTTPRTPGCVVAIQREFDGPDLLRARAWVDAMFAATGDDPPLPGLIAAHMHVSTDGARVLNLTQWASAEAHQALLDSTAPRLAANPEWRQVEEAWPGLERTTVRRYRPYRYAEHPPH